MLEPLRRLGKFTADGAVLEELVANVVPSSGPSTPLSLEVVAGNGKDHGVPKWDREDSNRLANRLQDSPFAD